MAFSRTDSFVSFGRNSRIKIHSKEMLPRVSKVLVVIGIYQKYFKKGIQSKNCIARTTVSF